MAKEPSKNEAAKKSLVALQANLKKAGQGPCTVFLHSKAGRDRADHWKRMKFDVSLTAGFRQEVLKQLGKQLSQKDEVEPYTYDDMVSGHVGFWPKAESDILGDWFKDVPEANWPHIFTGDGAFLRRVHFHATVIPLGGKTLTVFRHRGSGSLLHQGGLMAIFDTTEHQFKEAGGKVFHFDHGADFFEWDGFVYILSHMRFESLTNIRSLTAAKAQGALKSVERHRDIRVKDIDELSNVVNQKPMLARRLASAAEMEIMKALSGKAMVERIKALKLPIRHRKIGSVFQFEIDITNATEVQEFVNLIVDYYLRSPLTKKEYRVPSKYAA